MLRTCLVLLWVGLALAPSGLLAKPPVPGVPTAQAAPAVASARPDHLLLVSIDGLGWELLQAQRTAAPTLARLLSSSVAGPLETVFPSMTWAAHTSLITGMQPRRHGVCGNRYLDRATGQVVEFWQRPKAEQVRVPTLYDVAKARGWTTASLLWPSTNAAPTLDWNLPEVYGQRAFEEGTGPATRALLRDLGLQIGHLGRIGNEEMFLLDSLARDAAVHLVAHRQPRMMLLHFLSVDTAAHWYGPASVPARWGLELVDRYLADVLRAYERAGLLPRTAVIIVSDHGFLPVEQGVSLPLLLAGARLPAAEARTVTLVPNGHAVFVYLKEGKQTARTVTRLSEYLGKRAEIDRILTPDTFEDLGLALPTDDPRSPDLIALLKPGYMAVQGRSERAPMAGMHGYLPNHPSLHGIFLATGPGVAARKLTTPLRAVDVAPTAARWLGLELPGLVDGRARTDLLGRAP